MGQDRRMPRKQLTRWGLPFTFVSVLVLLPLAVGRAEPGVEAGKPPLSGSHSVGLAYRGMLVGGVRLEESEHVVRAGRRQSSGNWYGTRELVALIEDAARRVAAARPGLQLGVGDLSGPHGGTIEGHGSHESGRDVDIGFFVTEQGSPRPAAGWVELTARGTPVASARPPLDRLRFDDAANWDLVRSIVESPHAEVQYVFVASWLEQRLLREAARRGEEASLVERAAHVMLQPRNATPHADHFHVRIYCPEDDRPMCVDVAPFWPWTRRGREEAEAAAAVARR
ncbi:MAG: penicillin-insensitive murein endopeptidase [Deltaproteobacteria bacterium]|nr:penicillin-insensitive murein endopeptidase [Deltaproteobacteria bacterium]